MVNTILQNLSSVFTRVFVLGIVPLLTYMVLHGLVANSQIPKVKAWFDAYLIPEIKDPGLATLGGILLILTLGYVWNSLSVYFRELLEGKRLFARVARLFALRYANRLSEQEAIRDESVRQLARFRELEPQWLTTLREARRVGSTKTKCDYVRSPEFAELISSRNKREPIACSRMADAVTNFAAELRENSADLPLVTQSDALDLDNSELRRLIDYSRSRWAAQLTESLQHIEYDYAAGSLTPTMIGNIAQSTVHYAESRYGMDLNIFWPKLQSLLLKEEKTSVILEDANTRLDFVISLFWQSVFFTLFWTAVLPWYGNSRAIFLVIAIGGPFSCALWYMAALQHYRSLATTMRAALDLHRHALLEALHVPAPIGTNHERKVWDFLEQHFAYGSLQDVRFEEKAKP